MVVPGGACLKSPRVRTKEWLPSEAIKTDLAPPNDSRRARAAGGSCGRSGDARTRSRFTLAIMVAPAGTLAARAGSMAGGGPLRQETPSAAHVARTLIRAGGTTEYDRRDPIFDRRAQRLIAELNARSDKLRADARTTSHYLVMATWRRHSCLPGRDSSRPLSGAALCVPE